MTRANPQKQIKRRTPRERAQSITTPRKAAPVTERQILKLMRKFRRQKQTCLRMLEVIAVYARRYLALAEVAAIPRGKYREWTPLMARQISKTFYASDEDLAKCFGVTIQTFDKWYSEYPTLRKQIGIGRRLFHTKDGGEWDD